VDQHVGLVQVGEELVAQAATLVGAGDEAGDVDEAHRDEPDAVVAVARVGRAAWSNSGAAQSTRTYASPTLGSMVVKG